MKPTTAQRFGSLGKSFVSPSAAAAVIGAALLASDTSDTSETAWSPAAACLLPDVLPVAGTLLSYGGNRQLAAGGTVTHSGALSLENNALTCGGIKLNGSSSNNIERRTDVDMLMFQGLNSVYGVGIGSSGFRPGLVIPRLSKIYFSNDTQAATDEIELVRDSTSLFDVRCNNGMRVRNKANSADAALTCGAITASGAINSSFQVAASNIDSAGRVSIGGAAVFLQGTANTLEQRNGLNAQCFDLFETYTSSTNNGKLRIKATSSGHQIGSARATSGSNRAVQLGHFDAADAFTSAISVPSSGDVQIARNLVMSGTFPYFGLTASSWSGGTFYSQAGVDETGTGTGNFTCLINPVTKSFAILSGNPNTSGKKHLTIDGSTSLAVFGGAITASGTISGVAGSFITLGVSSGTSTFNQVQIAAGNSYFWNGRSQIASPSNGVVAFKNNAGSADAALTCGAITASGAVVATAATSHQLIGPVGASGGVTALRVTDNTNATFRVSFENGNRIMLSGNDGAHNLSFGGKSGDSVGNAFVERFRVDNAANTVNCYVPFSCGAITASGAVTVGTNDGASGRVTVGIGLDWGVKFGNRGTLGAYNDGVFGFRNNATTSGAILDVSTDATFKLRNRDNSADAALTCGAITASGDITLAASQRLFCSNGSTTGNYLLSGATAVFTTNSVAQGGWNSGGMYARKLFIDYANADICLARASASNLGIYAADGSTPAAMTVGAITASGAIQETPTQSALDPTTANIPSGKRMGWYNSTLSEFRDWVNIGGTLLKSAAYT